MEGSITFEVFKRLENVLYNVVSYPTDKAFGVWAWNTGNLKRANEILESITKRDKLKATPEFETNPDNL